MFFDVELNLLNLSSIAATHNSPVDVNLGARRPRILVSEVRAMFAKPVWHSHRPVCRCTILIYYKIVSQQSMNIFHQLLQQIVYVYRVAQKK